MNAGDLRPIKRLGQNFLRDPNTARNIVKGLRAGIDDPVVEIGPGTGALTGLLHDAFRRVTAVEIDERAAALMRETYPLVNVLEQDVLTIDWAAMADQAGGPLHVIGNLPYYITSPILFGLLDASYGGHLREAVIMMQYEVAERLVAVPRTKEYGILSVAVQHAAAAEILFPVSRNVFHPKPDVRSAVVRLTFPESPLGAFDVHQFRNVVRTAFNQRRKTLRNALKRVTEPLGTAVPDDMAGARAEELTPDDFVELTRYLHAAP